MGVPEELTTPLWFDEGDFDLTSRARKRDGCQRDAEHEKQVTYDQFSIPIPTSEGGTENRCPHHREVYHRLKSLRFRSSLDGDREEPQSEEVRRRPILYR